MRLILKTIRFSEAKRGIELTLKSADELFDDAEALSKRGSYSHAYFLLLTAYEELAKCLRIAEERAKNTATKNDLVLEGRLFGSHGLKYGLTMDYLDEWITAGDALRQRYFPNVVKADTSELQAERMALRKRGEWIRQRCLFTDVDDKNQWLEKLRITKATVELNLRMVRSMSDGFHSLLRFNGMDEEGGFAVPPE